MTTRTGSGMTAVLYNRDGWPTCTRAREFLSQAGVEYRSVSGEAARLDRAATVALGRQARRLLIKSGDRIRRLQGGLGDDELTEALLHPDGFLNVPILIVGDLLVRGFTDDLYREALGRTG